MGRSSKSSGKVSTSEVCVVRVPDCTFSLCPDLFSKRSGLLRPRGSSVSATLCDSVLALLRVAVDGCACELSNREKDLVDASRPGRGDAMASTPL
jgi:hypothetical protein